ncbi:hypothetical protein LXL04_033990 [Taraxacum kok-saghyz]
MNIQTISDMNNSLTPTGNEPASVPHNRLESGVPARCAGDSFIRRIVSFRKTGRPVISFRNVVKSCYFIYLLRYTHNVALTTFFLYPHNVSESFYLRVLIQLINGFKYDLFISQSCHI